MKISFSKFVLAVKLFILDVLMQKAYKKLDIAYNTACKIYNKIRLAIYHFISKKNTELSGEVEADESYFGGMRGSLIYTDKFRSYDGLVMYDFIHERTDKSTRFANEKVYINGIEGFWSYAKESLLKFHGVSKENFVYYLKEFECRYNNRENIDEMVFMFRRNKMKNHKNVLINDITLCGKVSFKNLTSKILPVKVNKFING